MNIDLNDLFNSTNSLDDKSTRALLKAMVGSHSSDFEYLKFKAAVASMKELAMDETTSFKSAYATGKTMGLTKEKLIISAKRYLGVLQTEGENFTEALKSQIDKNVNSRESMIAQLEERIAENRRKMSELEREIKLFQEKIDNVDTDIEAAQIKIDGTKERFRNSYTTITDIIKKDIELINLYL